MTQADFQSEYQNLLDVMDQPSIDGVNTYFVSKAAKKAGLKVALSGVGGDELFGGYPSFQQIPRMVGALVPFRHVPILGKGFRALSSPFLRRFTSPKYAGLLEYGSSYGGAYLLRRGLFMPWELPGLLDGDMARDGWAELQTLTQLEQTTRDINSGHLKITALESAWLPAQPASSKKRAVEEFRNSPLRIASHAGAAYEKEQEALRKRLRNLFDCLPRGSDDGAPLAAETQTGPLAGLIAPHIDVKRGGACFAASYADLAGRCKVAKIEFSDGKFVVSFADNIDNVLIYADQELSYILDR